MALQNPLKNATFFKIFLVYFEFPFIRNQKHAHLCIQLFLNYTFFFLAVKTNDWSV